MEYQLFSIDDLKAASINRPEGYYEEVLSLCIQEGDLLKMPFKEWVDMRNKYGPRENNLDNESFDPPQLKDMAKSVTKSVANWAGSGFKIAPKEVYHNRLDECKACPHWDSEALANTGQCKICGCSTVAKLRLATEKCPIGKW